MKKVIKSNNNDFYPTAYILCFFNEQSTCGNVADDIFLSKHKLNCKRVLKPTTKK